MSIYDICPGFVNTNLREWLDNNPPGDECLFKEHFWKEYAFWAHALLKMMIWDEEEQGPLLYGRFEEFVELANDSHLVIGEHWSKSIKHPILRIERPGGIVVIRYNFYNYEICVLSDFELDFPEKGLFKSGEADFFYQGFPAEYCLTSRYETDKRRFMVSIDDRCHLFTFMYLLNQQWRKLDKQRREENVPS